MSAAPPTPTRARTAWTLYLLLSAYTALQLGAVDESFSAERLGTIVFRPRDYTLTQAIFVALFVYASVRMWAVRPLAAAKRLARTRHEASTLTRFAGAGAGNAEGDRRTMRFSKPHGLAWHPELGLIVCDTGNHCLRTIRGDEGKILAGMPGQAGFKDGRGSAALFDGPTAVAVTGEGTVFVLDRGNRAVRRLDPTGIVQTIWLSPMGANYPAPTTLAVDAKGRCLVLHGHLFRISADGVVERLPHAKTLAAQLNPRRLLVEGEHILLGSVVGNDEILFRTDANGSVVSDPEDWLTWQGATDCVLYLAAERVLWSMAGKSPARHLLGKRQDGQVHKVSLNSHRQNVPQSVRGLVTDAGGRVYISGDNAIWQTNPPK